MVDRKIRGRAEQKKLRKQPTEYSASIFSSINYPVFCFHHLATNKYSLDKCERVERVACLNALKTLSQHTWVEIEANHIKGFHKIKNKDSIRVARPEPDPMPPDLPIIAFDYHNTQTMVGYRRECVFHIIWFDRDFSLYDHGS